MTLVFSPKMEVRGWQWRMKRKRLLLVWFLAQQWREEKGDDHKQKDERNNRQAVRWGEKQEVWAYTMEPLPNLNVSFTFVSFQINKWIVCLSIFKALQSFRSWLSRLSLRCQEFKYFTVSDTKIDQAPTGKRQAVVDVDWLEEADGWDCR